LEFAAPGDGLYRISVEVSAAAGNVGRSSTGCFCVDQASGLTPVYRFWSAALSRHFYTIRAGEGIAALERSTFWAICASRYFPADETTLMVSM
jgi:hypothetical protein